MWRVAADCDIRARTRRAVERYGTGRAPGLTKVSNRRGGGVGRERARMTVRVPVGPRGWNGWVRLDRACERARINLINLVNYSFSNLIKLIKLVKIQALKKKFAYLKKWMQQESGSSIIGTDRRKPITPWHTLETG